MQPQQPQQQQQQQQQPQQPQQPQQQQQTQATEIPPGPKTVFIGGISSRATEATLKALLEQQFGPIEAIRIVMDQTTGKSKGYGFVLFGTEEDADRLIAEQFVTFMNRRMNVSHSFKSNGRKVPPGPSPLVVFNHTPPESPPPSPPVTISVGVPPSQTLPSSYCQCAACLHQQHTHAYDMYDTYSNITTHDINTTGHHYEPACSDPHEYAAYDVQQPQSYHHYELAHTKQHYHYNGYPSVSSASAAPSIPSPPPHLNQKHQHQPYVAYQPPTSTPPITPPSRQETYPVLAGDAYGTLPYPHGGSIDGEAGALSQYYVDSSAMFSHHGAAVITEPRTLHGSHFQHHAHHPASPRHQQPPRWPGSGYHYSAPASHATTSAAIGSPPPVGGYRHHQAESNGAQMYPGRRGTFSA